MVERLFDSLFDSSFYSKIYTLTCGEQGLQLRKKSWRAADIAIFKKKGFALDDKYANMPPEVIIEINIKSYYEPLPLIPFARTISLNTFAAQSEMVIW